MAREDSLSAIERMLGFEFVSDPRKARFPIPETPAEYKAKHPERSYPHPSMRISPEMARDVLKYRVIRIERMRASCGTRRSRPTAGSSSPP